VLPALGRVGVFLQFKRQRGECDDERAAFARDLRYGRRGARARSAAEAGANKNHPRVRQGLPDFIGGFVSGVVADLGIAAGAEAARHRSPELDFVSRDRAGERLHVGVDRDEIGFVEAVEHDPVEHIRAGVADSDDLDGNFFFCLFRQAVIAAELNHRRGELELAFNACHPEAGEARRGISQLLTGLLAPAAGGSR